MFDLREVLERTRRAATDAAARLRPPYPPVAIELDRREARIVRLRRPWMYEVSIATWATKREPGADCTAFENSSALRQPSTFARNDAS